MIVYAWVAMSHHIHLIITTKNDDRNISEIIRDFKKYTLKLIAKSIETIGKSRREWLLNAMSKEAKRIGRATNHKLWKDDNHTICIDGKTITVKDRLFYYDNPVRSGLVINDREYIYSSAMNYQGKKGLVTIEFAF